MHLEVQLGPLRGLLGRRFVSGLFILVGLVLRRGRTLQIGCRSGVADENIGKVHAAGKSTGAGFVEGGGEKPRLMASGEFTVGYR